LIDRNNKEINLSRQANLLNISRSGIYYQPIINKKEIGIMNAIDKIYTKCPFYGSRKIKRQLRIEYEIFICRDYTRNLMRRMGLEAIYPRKRSYLSTPDAQHRKYPYLLRNLDIVNPNQVWSTDITYIRLKYGFIYLTAILDWFSRYVLSWKLSSTLESSFCVDALEKALTINLPKIHNSDQGSQFTGEDYLSVLENKTIQISMDGRGRYLDNIFTERLWRTVKYENVYLRDYQNIDEAQYGLSEYFKFYNTERIHQSLDYKTPEQIYFSKS
jgi:putative transposase